MSPEAVSAEADSRFIMAIQKCSTPRANALYREDAGETDSLNRTIIRISKHYTKNISANP